MEVAALIKMKRDQDFKKYILKLFSFLAEVPLLLKRSPVRATKPELSVKLCSASDGSKREGGRRKGLSTKRRELVLIGSRSNSPNLAVSPACLCHSQTHFSCSPKCAWSVCVCALVPPVLAHPARRAERHRRFHSSSHAFIRQFDTVQSVVTSVITRKNK